MQEYGTLSDPENGFKEDGTSDSLGPSNHSKHINTQSLLDEIDDCLCATDCMSIWGYCNLTMTKKACKAFMARRVHVNSPSLEIICNWKLLSRKSTE